MRILGNVGDEELMGVIEPKSVDAVPEGMAGA